MKLSEAMAILESTRTERFEATLYNEKKAVLYCEEGYFVIDVYADNGKKIESWKTGGAFNGNIRAGLDWRLVRPAVPWQEALQAWANGRVVSVYVPQGFGSETRRKDRGTMITEYEILKGLWYLEDWRRVLCYLNC